MDVEQRFDFKCWNERQRKFRRVLLGFEDHERAIVLFLRQHGMLHTGEVSGDGSYSFAGEILGGMTAEHLRRIPAREDHSVAWCFWHMARIEDVTMNVLLAGQPQILLADDWLARLDVATRDTGNASSAADVAGLSAAIDLDALLAYRTAVGCSTRENVKALGPEELKKKVDPRRLQQLRDEGAVVEEASELLDYWGRKTLAELLLMPPTRHNMVHLNEAKRIKKRKS